MADNRTRTVGQTAKEPMPLVLDPRGEIQHVGTAAADSAGADGAVAEDHPPESVDVHSFPSVPSSGFPESRSEGSNARMLSEPPAGVRAEDPQVEIAHQQRTSDNLPENRPAYTTMPHGLWV